MSTTPREFWVSGIDFASYPLEHGKTATAFITKLDPNRNEAIHVIEHNAYQALEQKLAVAVSALEQAIKDSICMCYGDDEPQAHRNPCIHCQRRVALEQALALINPTPKKAGTP